jgi:iron transport multicopper oxidase
LAEHETQAEQVGTYWYHSHVRGQYLDGLRGPLIIHDPENPFRAQFDEEMVLTLSDWYHKEMAELMPKYKNGGGMMSREPVPDATLLNDTQNLQVAVQPAKTYLVHAVNIGAFVGQYFWVEGHPMTIVELDGSYVRPTVAEMIYLASGQRCSFLLTTKAEASQNYPMVASMDRVRYGMHFIHGRLLTCCFQSLFRKADHVNTDVVGWLVYDLAQSLPSPTEVQEYNPIDDMGLVPYDDMPLLRKADQTITLSLNMEHKNGGSQYVAETFCLLLCVQIRCKMLSAN